jgi:hypothetical protein
MNMERKPEVAGGSKWTYEAMFRIAMKGGRAYYTTAAASLYKDKLCHNYYFYTKFHYHSAYRHSG